MIPQLPTGIETQNVEYDIQPSKTYKLDFTNKRLVGITDGLEAYRIAAQKTLMTERYAHIIYDGNYGFNKSYYIGKDFDFIKGSIERDIYEALSQDDRFQGIENFIITKTGLDSCTISFNVNSVEGTFSMEMNLQV